MVWLEKAAENGHRESDSRIVAVRKELMKQKESLKIHYVNAEPFGNIFNPLNNMLSLNKSSSLPNSQYKDSRFHSRRNETLLEELKSVRQQDDFIVFMKWKCKAVNDIFQGSDLETCGETTKNGKVPPTFA